MLDEYKRVLTAVDGSENSEKAFKHAVDVAKRNHAALYLLQVINDQQGTYSPFAYSEIMKEEEEAAEKIMGRNLAYAKERGVTSVKPIIYQGSPKVSIAKTIPEKFDIDLIVIGATGKGVVDRMIVGSTTNYVVQHSVCNVLVVKNH